MMRAKGSGFYGATKQTTCNICTFAPMMVYNETVIVDEVVHKQWLQWLQNNYLPLVMATGCFSNNTVLQVLDSPNDGVTYCVQFFTDNRAAYDDYVLEYQQQFQALQYQQFENQIVLFTTLMQTLN